MKNKYFYLVFILFGLLSGCATNSNYQQTINHWQGKNVQELRNSWGTPSSIAHLPNGNTLYVYNRKQLYTTPPMYPATSTNFAQIDRKNIYIANYNEAIQGQTLTRYCRTTFEANTQDIITQIHSQGSSCIASPFTAN